MITFSKRIERLHTSATLAAQAKVAALQAKGIDILNFTIGEPLFDTPEGVKIAAKKALDENWTHYAPVPGLPELRKAICEKLKKENGLSYTPDEIIVGCGAKQSIFIALQVLIDEGDEVLIPAPYWVSYPDQVKAAFGTPKILPTTEKTGFKITPQQLETAITKKTKLLIINSPSNPTGAAYSAAELKTIGDICLQHSLLVLSDEIYEHITYDRFRHISFAAAAPAMKDFTLTINGASKSYAMTGWRVGYTAAPKAIIDKMKTMQSQEITSIPTFIQRACITAFLQTQTDIARFVRDFTKQREAMLQGLQKIPEIAFIKPQGAFYFFPNFQKYLGKKTGSQTIGSDALLAEYLLEEAHVATTPGEAFGAPGYLRLSYAADIATIEKGMEKIRSALAKLEG